MKKTFLFNIKIKKKYILFLSLLTLFIIATFSIAQNNITYGPEYVFNPGDTRNYLSTTALDSTHFVVVYQDLSNNQYGTAVIGTVSGTTISYGPEYVFCQGQTLHLSVAALDSTHFVVVYENQKSPYGLRGAAVIGTVSGDTISYGSEYLFLSDGHDPRYLSTTALDSTHFVIAFWAYGGTSYSAAVIGTVSGTTISFGSQFNFLSLSCYEMSVSSLDSTHFVIAYKEPNYGYGAAKIGTVSGTSISYSSEYVFSPVTTSNISVSALDSTHFVVVYRGSNTAAIIGTVSGTTISFGSAYVFSVYSSSNSVSRFDSTHFVVAGQDYISSKYCGIARIGTVSGSTISFGSEYTFNPANTQNISASVLDSTHFVVAYSDKDNNYYGTAVIGSLQSETPSPTPTPPPPVYIPSVATNLATFSAEQLKNNQATLKGSIYISTGNQKADLRGFDWKKSTDTDWTGSWTEGTSGNYQYDTGEFTYDLTNISEGITYYYRAKAKNSAGWGYGIEKKLVTYLSDGGQKQFTTLSPSKCQSHSLWGFAWTENVGWISFSCQNCDSDGDGITDNGSQYGYLCPTGNPTQDYGVDLEKTDSVYYKLKGYAWSENIGWISFNRSDTGSPPDSDPCPDASCISKLNSTTNEVSGWARACSVFQLGCSGTLNPNRGNWDGWIKMRR